ncbi:MAG TPA: hypothetical protein VFK05_13640, partial [Polyangiaceae bacterium]|nr:hypothetical protein [Polyangiaceae bacterium]
FLLIPKRSHSSVKLSSASSIAAMNRTRSFIGDVSFQGMTASVYTFENSVTYVAGSICHLCTRFEPSIFVDRFGVRSRVDLACQMDLGRCFREASRGGPFASSLDFAAIFERKRACVRQ